MKTHWLIRGTAVLIAAGALLLTVLTAAAQSRWGTRGCPPVGGIATTPAYEWRHLENDSDHVYLYRSGVQIGGWCYSGKFYRAFDTASQAWGDRSDYCPAPVPVQARAPAEPEPIAAPAPVVYGDGPNFGIDLEKMQSSKPGHRYHLNGKEVCRDTAFEAVGAPAELPDDADALRLTWIGPAAVGARIRTDLDAAAAWKGKVSLQSYASVDEPILRGLGYAPGLAVQAPAGKPLWYCADYKGAEDLAGGLLLADARRKDPAWDPAHWPALNAPPKAPDPAPVIPNLPKFSWPSWLWGIGGAIVVYLLTLSKKGNQ